TGIGAGQESVARVCVRYEDRRADSFQLAKAFVVYKKERLVFPDRAAEAGAELVSAKRRIAGAVRLRRRIKVIARVQFVVAEKLVERAVGLVGAGLADGVQYSPVSAELRAVRRGQRLEFCDGFDAQRTTGCTGAHTMAEKARHIGVVQEVGLAVEP